MDLEKKASQIRDLVIHQCSRREKDFLGGPPYSDHIIPGLQRYNEFSEIQKLPERSRVNLATVCNDSADNVIGYQSTTIIRNGQPTIYEKKYIGLNEPFSYGILKYIVVSPEFRNGIIARSLLRTSLELTLDFGVPSWVADVNAENRPMLVFLRNRGMESKFNWVTPSDTRMIRMGTNNALAVIASIMKIENS